MEAEGKGGEGRGERVLEREAVSLALALALGEAGYACSAVHLLRRTRGVHAASLCAGYQAMLRATREEIAAACAAARALPGSLSRANKVHAARNHWLLGEIEKAAELAAEAANDRSSGAEGRAIEGGLLQAEIDGAMYAAEAWPEQTACSRADVPFAGGPAARLQLACQKLAALLKRDVNCVRAHALKAELCLESVLYQRLLRTVTGAVIDGSACTQGADGHDGSRDDEIRALCVVHGLSAAKTDSPAERLRVIEAHRKQVLAEGRPGAMAEADELSKLHEYQMSRLGLSVDRPPGAKPLAGGASVVGAAPAADEDLVTGLTAIDAALRVEEARHAPAVLLLKGRLLLLAGQPAEALVPLNACLALIEPTAHWRQVAVAAAARAAATSDAVMGADTAAKSDCAAVSPPPADAVDVVALSPSMMMGTAHAVDFETAALYAGLAAADSGVPWEHVSAALVHAMRAAPTQLEATTAAGRAHEHAGGLLARHGCRSPLCPDLPRAACVVAEGELGAGHVAAAAASSKRGLALASALLAAIGPAAAGVLAVRHEQTRLYECLVRSLVGDGREDEALVVCVSQALPHVRALGLDANAMAAQLQTLAELWIELSPHSAEAHAARAEALLMAFETDARADASPGSHGEALLKEARASFERAIGLEGKPQGRLQPSRPKLLAKAEAERKAASERAASASVDIAREAETAPIKAAPAAAGAGKVAGGKVAAMKPSGATRAPVVKAASTKPSRVTKAPTAKADSTRPPVLGKAGGKPFVSKVETASGSGLRAVKALSPPKSVKQEAGSAPGSKSAVAPSEQVPSTATPLGESRPEKPVPPLSDDPPVVAADLSTPASASGHGAPPETDLDAAALRALVEEERARRAESTPTEGEVNLPRASTRLGLVRACRELGEPNSAMRALLQEAIDFGGELPATLYEELGNLLKVEGEGEKAVELWCSYPFSPPPSTFEENVLRLSAANLMVALGMHADEAHHERLKGLLIGIGKGFGSTSHVDKHVDALEAKGFVQLCKDVYCGITGLPEEEQRALFQSKGWAPAFSSMETVAKPLGRRARAPPRQLPRPTPPTPVDGEL